MNVRNDYKRGQHITLHGSLSTCEYADVDHVTIERDVRLRQPWHEQSLLDDVSFVHWLYHHFDEVQS